MPILARAGLQPRHSPFVWLFGCIAIAALTMLVWPTPPPAVATTTAPDEPVPAVVATTTVTAAAAAAESAAARGERTEAPPTTAAPPEPSFAERIDTLVALGEQTAFAAQNDDIAAARASDAKARESFDDLMARFPDAGERALAQLSGLAEPHEGGRDFGRRTVLQLVLDHELARRQRAAARSSGETPPDEAPAHTSATTLVQQLLDLVPQSLPLAAVGEYALHDRPYLRACHEAAVLGLVRLAGEDAFPRDVATKLLLTLWHNLQQFGERSTAELSQLALALLGDSDPSHRTAACRQLLADARYRNLVLSWLRENSDRTVVRDVANLAARELPPGEALAILRELAPVLPQAPNAFLILGYRAPETLADAYRELLASDTQPAIRSGLVTGVGMAVTPLGLEIAELALEQDPSPDVRLQAVFALTARGDADLAERAISRALDDPRITADPVRLSSVVFALENLEASGHANHIHRAAQRLLATPLSAASRRTLEALLQRSLPGGTGAEPVPSPSSVLTPASR